jgi:hypothetical protein
MSIFQFAFFPPPFQSSENGFKHFLRNLENISMPEKWDFSPEKQDKEILYNYIVYIFQRIQHEEKLMTGKASFKEKILNYAAFNTGLLTNDTAEEIYVFFVENNRPERQPWVYLGVGTSTHRRFEPILREAFKGIPPQPADFIQGQYSKLVLNPTKSVFMNYAHFLERRERLPTFMQQMPADTVKVNLNFALEIALRQVRRNYRYAVPMFYVDENRLQLLLPFVLSFSEKAGFALIVDEKEDGTYFASTLLTFQSAYKNARLLTKPSEWLTL